MGRTRPRYPSEFRAEAVHLVRQSGKSLSQLAKDLGIADQSLRNRVKQADLDAGRRSDGLTTEERDGLRQLRRENRVLREEREILKKAAAFFARETGSKPLRQSFPHRGAARLAIFEYIEGFYNPRRRHSALGYLSPAEYERRRWDGRASVA